MLAYVDDKLPISIDDLLVKLAFWWGIGELVISFGFFAGRLYVAAGAFMFFAVIHLIYWWRNGGGPRFKRRLRSWVRSFTPTRRTAPQAA